MQIQKKLTPYNFTQMTDKHNKYIVIHYVGAVSSAKNNAIYYASKKLNVSAHYFVDAKEIWQSVEDWNRAWHCGSENGIYYHNDCRNNNSIGIEMCVKKDANGNWYFESATVLNTIELVKALMQKYDIPIENVLRHYDVTHKICPEPYVTYPQYWEKFKNDIMKVEELIEPNDIVWELSVRKIVSDVDGLLQEISQTPNGRLYWLCRKAVNYMREKKV